MCIRDRCAPVRFTGSNFRKQTAQEKLERLKQLMKSGKEYRWKKHDSVTVSGNRWYRHSLGRGGYPVDFVMEFYNATFLEAVKMLTGEEGEGRNSACPAPSPDFRLPEKEENNDRI